MSDLTSQQRRALAQEAHDLLGNVLPDEDIARLHEIIHDLSPVSTSSDIGALDGLDEYHSMHEYVSQALEYGEIIDAQVADKHYSESYVTLEISVSPGRLYQNAPAPTIGYQP